MYNFYKKSFPQQELIRNLCLGKFCDASVVATSDDSQKERTANRAVAKGYLLDGVERIEKLYNSNTNDTVKKESLLALAELNFKAEKYKVTINWCQKAVDALSSSPLKAQAYYYLSKSYTRLGDKDKGRYYRRLIRQDYPKQAKRLYTSGNAADIEALMRHVAYYYRLAEKMDDIALTGLGSTSAVSSNRVSRFF